MEKGLVVHLQKASELEISLSSRKTYFFLRCYIVKIYKSGPGFLVFAFFFFNLKTLCQSQYLDM